jgi:protoporphyrinogen/coproporphyrinogen III oxidase
VVVGAGVTGLVVARRLASAGLRVVVLEASDRIGGQLRSAVVAGRTVDVGAEAVFAHAPGPLELLDELGQTDQLVAASSHPTWIWTPRGLRPLPDGVTPAGPTRLAPLLASRILSPAGMLRAGLEPLVPRADHVGDVSVGDHLARRLGNEVVDRLVDPLLGGLHAGDVRALSLRAATPGLAVAARRRRSLLLGRRPTRRPGPAFVALRGGMERLADRLGAPAPGTHVRTGTPVRMIERAGARLVVTTERDGAITTDLVVVAAPAHAAARMLHAASPAAATQLHRLRAASAAVVVLAYPGSAASTPALAGATGMLVPSSSPLLLKAATFLSTKWPHHRADELFLVRASAGRIGDDRTTELTDTELVARLHDELAAATGLADAPVDAIVQRWPSTLPQLEVGHHERLATVSAALARDLPGVVLAGAPYHGPGLGSCVRSAEAAARAGGMVRS